MEDYSFYILEQHYNAGEKGIVRNDFETINLKSPEYTSAYYNRDINKPLLTYNHFMKDGCIEQTSTKNWVGVNESYRISGIGKKVYKSEKNRRNKKLTSRVTTWTIKQIWLFIFYVVVAVVAAYLVFKFKFYPH